MKELEQIASQLVDSYLMHENDDDLIGLTIRQKLKEIPDNADVYLCPACKTSIENKIFKLQEGKCPTCGTNVQPIYEHITENIYNEKRYTCPYCKTSKLYKLNESSTCSICNHTMDVYTPYVKPKMKAK